MSIFIKILFLFLASLVLMLYLSIKSSDLYDSQIALIYKSKYLQASKEFFDDLAIGDMERLRQRAAALGYEIKENPKSTNMQTIYEQKVSFGSIKILQQDDLFLLYMQYLDDVVLFFDRSQHDELEQKEHLGYLVFADIALLVLMFLLIVTLLSPLKNIAAAMSKFGRGDFSSRLKQDRRSDEIGQINRAFNTMAQDITTLLETKREFINDISHELRMPISKSKLALEMISPDKYTEILKKSIEQIDGLTHELLELQKLSSKHLQLNLQSYDIEALLVESLSKMIIVNEEDIEINIISNFNLRVDMHYMSSAIKNLIDNALKYKTDDKVSIKAQNSKLYIENKAAPLSKDLAYYMREFTQEDSSRGERGYGIGLNLVARILAHHHLELEYQYTQGRVVFVIDFSK